VAKEFVMKNNRICIALAAGLFASSAILGTSSLANAQASKVSVTSTGVEKPASMLWAGNSFFYYNNSLHGHITALLASADPTYRVRQTSVTISGSGIDWHDMESYFRPKAIGSYSFDANNNVVFNNPTRLFDIAIMMDCSQCPIHPTLSKVFTEYAKKNANIARKNGAKPVFFMSWAYADKPEMTQELAEAYIKAGNENDALVIPVGVAFARSIAKRPDISLYAADKRHPSLAGTYLSAVTSYAAIFKKSPVGLKYDAGLGAETAAHLQAMAQETVDVFYK
jgi:hypothetical protein